MGVGGTGLPPLPLLFVGGFLVLTGGGETFALPGLDLGVGIPVIGNIGLLLVEDRISAFKLDVDLDM